MCRVRANYNGEMMGQLKTIKEAFIKKIWKFQSDIFYSVKSCSLEKLREKRYLLCF